MPQLHTFHCRVASLCDWHILIAAFSITSNSSDLLFFCLKYNSVFMLRKSLGTGCLDMSCVYYIFATLGLSDLAFASINANGDTRIIDVLMFGAFGF